MSALTVHARRDVIRFAVRVQPRASRSEIAGATSRTKVVEVRGASAAAVQALATG